jgi:hypothetical protein
MTDADPIAALDEAARDYRETKQAHEKAQETVIAAALDALRAGKRPTEVVDHSPFTAAYVRKLARDNGIEPAKKGKTDG